MGSSWRPSDSYGRYGPHIFRRFELRAGQTPPPFRGQSRESSLPSPVCTTSRVADCYRPGEALFRSTPPTSPRPGRYSPLHSRRTGVTSPVHSGSEEGQIREGYDDDDSDAATIIQRQDKPHESIKFGAPAQIKVSPAKSQSVPQRDKKTSEAISNKPKHFEMDTRDFQKSPEQIMPSKPTRQIPRGPAGDRKKQKSSYAKFSIKDCNHQLARRGSVNLKNSSTSKDIDNFGTYPNNLAVARPRARFICSEDGANNKEQERALLRDTDNNMKEPSAADRADLSELLKDQLVVSKKVRDSGCQAGLSSHSPSYFTNKGLAGHAKPRDQVVEMQDVKENGMSTCMISLTPPKPQPKRRPSGAAPVSALEDVDIEFLVSRIVGELEGKLFNVKSEGPKVKTEKAEKKEQSQDKRMSVSEPQSSGKQLATEFKERAVSRSTNERSMGSTTQPTLKRLVKRTSKPETGSDDGGEEDEGAFQRRCRRVSNTGCSSASKSPRKRTRSQSPAFDSHSDNESRSPNSKTLEGLHFKKRQRVETPATEGQRKIRSPSIAFSAVESPCPFERRAAKRGRETPLKFKKQLSMPVPAVTPAKISAPSYIPGSRAVAKAVASQRPRQKSLPETYWFQRYFNHLTSTVPKIAIPTKSGRCFNRCMLSHYLGGNPRMTISSISASAMLSSVHNVSCIVAIKKEFVPKPTNAGEVIIVSSPHNFEKQLPPGVSTFPVFLERGTSRWEYMGTYKFDKCKLFTNREATDLQEQSLVNFWLQRMFEIRQKVDGARDTVRRPAEIEKILSLNMQMRSDMSRPSLCETSVKSLAAQLVPAHVKSRKHVAMLTVDQVKKYFQDGTLRFNWNFLKPVGYDVALFENLCSRKWPLHKKEKRELWSGLMNSN